MTGAVGALAAFPALVSSSEAQLLSLLGAKADAILGTATHLNWLPECMLCSDISSMHEWCCGKVQTSAEYVPGAVEMY